MYLLKKAIELREHSHPDHEKPFLEHLDDLRTMIVRIVITLLIAMVVCFAFNKRLLDFFRAPVDKVLYIQLEKKLPEHAPHPLTVELWESARKLEHAAINLAPEQRGIFYQSLHDDSLVFHAKTVSLLRATMVLPKEKREGFIKALNEAEDLKGQLRALLISQPGTDSAVKGDLNMMVGLKPTEGFMLSMKLSFVAGIVLSFPLLLLYILQFVLPGLHSHEKKVLWPSMAVGFGLFLTGAAFAYYLVLPRALLFFAEWSSDMGISNDWRIGEYISFATQFTLLFGLSFELPVVVMVFVKLGLLSYETMSSTRSYAIVAIFVAAAVLTPTPDMLTMTLMAAPMIILYEICIWLAYFDRKKSRVREEEEARESAERMLRLEEKRQAASDAEITVEEEPPQQDFHAHEPGDDGWHEEYPQQDHHASDELPPVEDHKPDHDVPEDGERKRHDP